MLLCAGAAASATLSGSIKDPSGAALAGVAVEVHSVPPVGSGKTVKSKKQAIAIGLSEARAKGKKVPAKKSA